jgi:hypothetical protein
MLTTATMSNAAYSWEVLLDEYQKIDINSMVDINKSELATCKLSSENEDHALWISWLNLIKEWLSKIGIIYAKNEYNMILHIFANLPQNLYMDIIVTIRVIGLQKYGLEKVITELKEKWKDDIKIDYTGKLTEFKCQLVPSFQI